MDDELDESFTQLAQNGRLRVLELGGSISSTTLVAIVDKCHELTLVRIDGICDVDTSEAAVETIRSLGRVHVSWKRKLVITRYRYIGIWDDKWAVWKSQEVKSALEELKEAAAFEIEVHME